MSDPTNAVPAEVDVLIVGAGISGIAAAYYLKKDAPETRFAILESETSFGGTWWTHRFPGIRSDSDLHTFGYSFEPWVGPPIATADEILKYMGRVIDANEIERSIHYRHRVLQADWREADCRWHVVAEHGDTPVNVTARFLFMCQGYYRHNEGYLPDWEGLEDFQGEFVHCENWPDNTVVNDKHVVVIGSGATAATVVPAIAGRASHVTMLQRSPTYFRAGRNEIPLVQELREIGVDEATIHDITRRKLLYEGNNFTARCFAEPAAVKHELIGAISELLAPDYDVDTHFTPHYDPWTQRLAFVPDGDLFQGIRDGDASVVTGEIDRFVANGIRLQDGRVIEADLVAAATGFNMNVMGDIDFSIDGKPIDFHDTVTYRGMMFTGVPNLAWVFGYFRASWTLRSELVAQFVCRLMAHLDATGYDRIEVALGGDQVQLERHDWINRDDFDPAYLERAVHLLPQRLDLPEWQHQQNYWLDKDEIPGIDLNDAVFRYRSVAAYTGQAAEGG